MKPFEELRALLTAAESAIEAGGEYNLAENSVQQVVSALDAGGYREQDDRMLRVGVARILGVVAWRRGQYSIALEYLTEALRIGEELVHSEEIAAILGNIGSVYLAISDYPHALEYYQRAVTMLEGLSNQTGVARWLGNIAVVHWNLSEFSQALEYYGRALAIDEEIGNTAGVATHLGNIGIVYWSLSDYSRALNYYSKALALDEKLGNKARVTTHLGNLGGVHDSLGEYDLALEYYDKALGIAQALGDRAAEARHLGNIGLVHMNLSDYSRALEFYGKAAAIAEEIGYTSGLAIHLGNIGIVHVNLSNCEQAFEYLNKALAIDEELGNKEGVAAWLGTLGVAYSQPDCRHYNPSQAEEILRNALAMNESLGTKRQNVEVLKTLSDLYAHEQRWKESREMYDRFHHLEKEVLSEETSHQARLMEHRRKIEESERDRQIKLVHFQEQEKILHNILPSHIAERIVSGEKTIADTHENVSVFFSDIVGFTKLSQRVSAVELVGMLNGIFTQFDQLARKHGLEKIKTIGDAYMAVCGAPIHVDNHAERAANFALDVAELMNNYHASTGDKIMIRIGLHSGSVVAGIIGENKFAYDMWGDAVNTASRMESHGEPGKIHVSEEFLKKLLMVNGEWLIDVADDFSSFTINHLPLTIIPRGEMEIKGKGKMNTYFLEAM